MRVSRSCSRAQQAAAIPEVWLTAYQLLHFVGRVKPGHNVLVHAGASGVCLHEASSRRIPETNGRWYDLANT